MLELDKFGGKRFKENWTKIETEINQNAPVNGLGIVCDVTSGGTQISTEEAVASAGGSSSSSGVTGGGATVDLYGAFNGQPALFHLKQTSAPTPLE